MGIRLETPHRLFPPTLAMDVEDILQDALPFDPSQARVNPDEEGVIRYGPLVLRVAAKVDLLSAACAQPTDCRAGG
jgi:hypothetical protein